MRQRQTGKRSRVCNADCYNAKCKECHCICGGRNHGIGLAKARDNVRKIFEPLMKTEESLKKLGVFLEVVRHQADLFDPAA